MKTKDLTLYALLTAVCVVGRFLTQVIPNAQPVTAIILLITLYIGPHPAVIISALSMIITNFYLGMGIWTIAQVGVFILLILLIHQITRITPLKQKLSWQLITCVWMSLLYGFLVSLFLAPFLESPIFGHIILAVYHLIYYTLEGRLSFIFY
ncbi:MAG: ECF transporter S component [Enterococcus sp.]|uniref:ECF transporter S component n=1 Tax=Enterococcus sp. TaxID=35783 RepID=UPI002FCA3400